MIPESQILKLREESNHRPQTAMMTLITTAYYQPVESSAISVKSQGTAPMGISGDEPLSRTVRLPLTTPVRLNDLALWLAGGIIGVVLSNKNDSGEVYYSLEGSPAKFRIPPLLHTVLFTEDASQVLLWGSEENLKCEFTFLPK